MARPIMTTDYRELKGYEGEEVTLIRWAWSFDENGEKMPSRARILKDYPRTVLFELTFEGSEWGISQLPPRRIVKAIPKAAMAAGDIRVKVKRTGERLVGQNITKFTAGGEAELWKELMKL